LECLRKFIVFGKQHLDHLPPVRQEPDEIVSLRLNQIEVKSYVGGLVKGFERKAA
jgi:hypothetical protein